MRPKPLLKGANSLLFSSPNRAEILRPQFAQPKQHFQIGDGPRKQGQRTHPFDLRKTVDPPSRFLLDFANILGDPIMRPKPLLKDAISLLNSDPPRARALISQIAPPKHHFQLGDTSRKQDERTDRSIREKSWTNPHDFCRIPRRSSETRLCVQNPY